jgi:hypothetical protein
MAGMCVFTVVLASYNGAHIPRPSAFGFCLMPLHRLTLFAALLVTCLAAASGCKRSSLATVYSYEVRCGEGGKAARVGAEPVHANCGDNTLDITGGQLKVNGKTYGRLKDKDAVLVEANGQVFVNKVKRVAE